MGDKNNLDQFYTATHIAEKLIKHINKFIPKEKRKLFIEPSAGAGAFYALLKDKCLGFDLEPKCEGIKMQDFFELKPEHIGNDKTSTCIIGNPPFGKCANLAIQFVNHATNFADTIAFILPRTFYKRSVQRKINPFFSIEKKCILPKDSFVFNGKPYDVPCVFQIWTRTQEPRNIEKPSIINEYFDFVKKENAELFIRRVGGRTGRAFLDGISESSSQSNYYIKIKKKNISPGEFVGIINSIDFSDIINHTAGQKSLSKEELIEEFIEELNNLREANDF
jgi:hypothetical protein